MIILRDKVFSKNKKKKMSIADTDYLNDRMEDKKAVRNAKAGGAILGGMMGGTLALPIGAVASETHGNKALGTAALLGTAAGAAGGYYLGKKVKKQVEDKADNEIKRYLKSSEKDRKYLRDRKAREEDKELMRQIAYNSYRW